MALSRGHPSHRQAFVDIRNQNMPMGLAPCPVAPTSSNRKKVSTTRDVSHARPQSSMSEGAIGKTGRASLAFPLERTSLGSLDLVYRDTFLNCHASLPRSTVDPLPPTLGKGVQSSEALVTCGKLGDLSDSLRSPSEGKTRTPQYACSESGSETPQAGIGKQQGIPLTDLAPEVGGQPKAPVPSEDRRIFPGCFYLATEENSNALGADTSPSPHLFACSPGHPLAFQPPSSDSPPSLFLETPSFVALRSSSPENESFSSLQNTFVNDAACPGMWHPFDAQHCATPPQVNNDPFSTQDTNDQELTDISRSRSLASLMSALQSTAPAIGHSLLTDYSYPDLSDIEYEENMSSSSVSLAQYGGRDPTRDTLMILGDLEQIVAEMKGLPVPTPAAPCVDPANRSTCSTLAMIGRGASFHEDSWSSLDLAFVDEDYSDGDDTSSYYSARPPSSSTGSERTRPSSLPVTPVEPSFSPAIRIPSPPSDTPSTNTSSLNFNVVMPPDSKPLPLPPIETPNDYSFLPIEHPPTQTRSALPPLPRSSNPSRGSELLPWALDVPASPREPTVSSFASQKDDLSSYFPSSFIPSSRVRSPGPRLKSLFKSRQPGTTGGAWVKKPTKGEKAKPGWGDSFLEL